MKSQATSSGNQPSAPPQEASVSLSLYKPPLRRKNRAGGSPSLSQQMPGVHHIELNLRDINQLFNTMDPSPFHEKDLDHDAEEFILSWAQEFHRHEPVDLNRASGETAGRTRRQTTRRRGRAQLFCLSS